MTEYCTVIAPTLNRAVQQTAVKEVTRALPSLAEWGVPHKTNADGSLASISCVAASISTGEGTAKLKPKLHIPHQYRIVQ